MKMVEGPNQITSESFLNTRQIRQKCLRSISVVWFLKGTQRKEKNSGK